MARDHRVREAMRVGSVADLPDPRSTPVGPRRKSAARTMLVETGTVLAAHQEALYAEAAAGGGRSVLLVLQGMDTSGKGGTIGRVMGMLNPHGVRVAAFGAPSEEERRHHFLWRVRRQVPEAGRIGVFDRSHYEDVLVPRVRRLLPADQWRKRYAEINDFERELAESGTTVLKVFLHISPEEQLERLRKRLTDPAKYWKYSPADLDDRALWSDFQRAYADVFEQTSTPVTPWYVVPADRKWYRNWAVANLLAETLDELSPRFPAPGYDRDFELARLDADPLAAARATRRPR